MPASCWREERLGRTTAGRSRGRPPPPPPPSELMWILETGVSGVNSGCVWRRLSEDERPPPPPEEDEEEREEWSPWVGEMSPPVA